MTLLSVPDVNTERRTVYVRQGKGKKDRIAMKTSLMSAFLTPMLSWKDPFQS